MEATHTKISKIETAPIAKRLFAGIMDAILLIFMFAFFSILVFKPIANATMGYDSNSYIGETYQIASHLFYLEAPDEQGEYHVVEVKDSTGNPRNYTVTLLAYSKNTSPTFYLRRIYYYYHNFKCNEDIELPTSKTFDPIKDHFASPIYEEKIGDKAPKDLYNQDWFNKYILELDKESTYFKIDDSKDNYIDSIVLKDESKKEDALKFLRNKAYEGLGDLGTSSFYYEIYSKARYIQLFIILSGFTLSYSIFFITIPLIMKDGETLGKKSMHISVISFDGYKAKKRQILFREVLLFIVMVPLGIFFGVGLSSFAIMGVGVLILLILTLFSKTNRTIFDFAAYTRVVDSIHSVWFKNEYEELRHEKEVEDNLAKYKKYIPDNPNLIQVGSEIVDEDLKKEIEQEKNKK